MSEERKLPLIPRDPPPMPECKPPRKDPPADRTQRRVVCAAIRAKDGDIIIGVRHYDRHMHDQINMRVDGAKFRNRLDEDQGFVDQFGVFLSREEAYALADRNGQLIYPNKCASGLDGHKLYDEGLY